MADVVLKEEGQEPLTGGDMAKYTILIDEILGRSDLSKISAKKIRKELAAKLEKDISSQKEAINELIMERFDEINSKQSSSSDDAPLSGTTNASKRQAPDTPPTESDREAPAPKKKKVKSEAMDDAKLARLLQEQENSRARPSRAGVVRKAAPKKKAPKVKRKSAAKIKGYDDSDMELGSDGEKKVKEKKGGFHKPYAVSDSLFAITQEATLSRPQIVKKLWEHIHKHDLQDPTDKRQILCDERMQAIFHTQKLHMFTMNKLLGKHLYPVEDAPGTVAEAKVESDDE